MQLNWTEPIEALVIVLESLQGVLVVVSLVAMMTALGTRLTRGDVGRTIREYRLVLRWVFANLLAVPVFAVLLGRIVGLPRSLYIGLLLVAVAPGAPFIPQLVSMTRANSQEAVRLTAGLTIVATVTVPVLVAAVLALIEVETGFAPWRFLYPLVVLLVVPLLAGGVLRDRRPGAASQAARWLTALANVTLLAALTIVVVVDFGGAIRVFTALVGTGALLVMALFVLATIGVGWLTGGPTPQNRRILALGTAGRNINIALFIATGAFPASEADAGITAFAVVMVAVSLLVAWYWRRHPLPDGVGSSSALTQ
ncbi:bile acid:sodium symporter family protein [Haloarchaeobius baliensis]|uniref:bile acid:sodium symporter family protein n=1 Tax=Haloarchaeobius baliensis TaxID=1670458 RepID=UPI003F88431E